MNILGETSINTQSKVSFWGCEKFVRALRFSGINVEAAKEQSTLSEEENTDCGGSRV